MVCDLTTRKGFSRMVKDIQSWATVKIITASNG